MLGDRTTKKVTMKNKAKAGDFVQSRYRAHWVGIVKEVDSEKENCWLTVKQLIDRNGRSIPRNLQKTVTYHADWFEKVEAPDSLNIQ